MTFLTTSIANCVISQLVCYYYVLTTFTTVGYGMVHCCHCLSLSWGEIVSLFCVITGDVYATNQGELVASLSQRLRVSDPELILAQDGFAEANLQSDRFIAFSCSFVLPPCSGRSLRK